MIILSNLLARYAVRAMYMLKWARGILSETTDNLDLFVCTVTEIQLKISVVCADQSISMVLLWEESCVPRKKPIPV